MIGKKVWTELYVRQGGRCGFCERHLLDEVPTLLDVRRACRKLLPQLSGHARGFRGWNPTTFRIEVDHVFPRALGGGSEFDNLQLLHSSCNWLKDCHRQRTLKPMRSRSKAERVEAREEVKKAWDLRSRRSAAKPKRCAVCRSWGHDRRHHRERARDAVVIASLPGGIPDWYPETDGQMAEWFAESEGGL